MVNASQITEHMEVVGSCGNHVGTVDHMDGNRIKLTRTDSADGKHKFMPLDAVDKVEGGKVMSKKNHIDTLAQLQAA